MKKQVIYLIIVFILSISVFAYSKDLSLTWLSNPNNVKWSEGPIDEKAFALLALNANNIPLGNTNDILLQRKDQNDCYPKGNCNVKDTALMVLALKSSNINITGLLSWLNSALTKASVSNWYIQIKTEKVGNCTLTYDQVNDETYKTKKIFVNGTEKIKIDNKLVNWIDVQADLGLILDKPVENIEVDCNEVNDPDIVISLLRILNQETNFYIIQESPAGSSTTDLTINNACYPIKKGGSCDEQSSFYAAYALKELGNDNIQVLPYLLDKADTIFENAVLYKITNNQKFADYLISKQNKKSYWDNQDIFTTSFAINALRNSNYQEKIENSTEWLKSKQASDGSFGSIRNTGAAIYLVLTESASTPYNQDNDNEEPSDDTTEQETTEECTEDSDCEDPETQYCDPDLKKCVNRGNGEENKPECETDSDCTGMNEVCIENECKKEENSSEDNSQDNNEEGTTESEKGGSSWIIILVVILVLGLAVGAYFAYNKFLKKPGKPNSPGPYSFGLQTNKPIQRTNIPQKPRQQYRRTATDDRLEQELDKSIREAENLLKK